MNVYKYEDDGDPVWLIAEDEHDAVIVLQDAGVDPPHAGRLAKLSGDLTLGDEDNCGEPVTKTCEEWARDEGRGLLGLL